MIKRELIFGERMMHVDMDTHINCVFAVCIAGDVREASLRAALGKMQQRHPLLQARIEEDKQGVPYFVSSSPLLPIPIRHVQRITADDWKRESAMEWGIPFDKEKGPLARLVWLKGADGVSDLLLTCPHCLVDGSSCVTLMRELLLLLDGQEINMDTYNTFLKVEDLLPAPFPGKKAVAWKAGIFAALLPLFLGFGRAKHSYRYNRSYFINWGLGRELTTALADRCRKEEASVYTACTVAFCQAFEEVLGKEANGKVICPVDIRKFLPMIGANQLFAFAPITELDIKGSKKMDFWQKAGELKRTLNRHIQQLNVPELMLMSEYFRSSAGKMVKLLMRKKGSHDATFSNMGKLNLPEYYQHFNVEAVYSPTVSFPWRNPNTLVLSTFKGEMNFSLISNDSFLREELALLIKERAMDHFKAALSTTIVATKEAC